MQDCIARLHERLLCFASLGFAYLLGILAARFHRLVAPDVLSLHDLVHDAHADPPRVFRPVEDALEGQPALEIPVRGNPDEDGPLVRRAVLPPRAGAIRGIRDGAGSDLPRLLAGEPLLVVDGRGPEPRHLHHGFQIAHVDHRFELLVPHADGPDPRGNRRIVIVVVLVLVLLVLVLLLLALVLVLLRPVLVFVFFPRLAPGHPGVDLHLGEVQVPAKPVVRDPRGNLGHRLHQFRKSKEVQPHDGRTQQERQLRAPGGLSELAVGTDDLSRTERTPGRGRGRRRRRLGTAALHSSSLFAGRAAPGGVSGFRHGCLLQYPGSRLSLFPGRKINAFERALPK
ncbi:unnamed protein product [Pseudo-nitzschia multistriata]|uniref:Uncharacterized protein n=1 Tax=Pseudo-nitzschia multistriata TaxID=183589 RepID=A0A448Z190_9STRA|nr:unnamed protein product [Pseudo-nitzschia multistriata]